MNILLLAIILTFTWVPSSEPDLHATEPYYLWIEGEYEPDAYLWKGVDTTCTITINRLDLGCLRFVLTARDQSGNESAPSEPVVYYWKSDHDRDCDVDGTDLADTANQYGRGVPSQ